MTYGEFNDKHHIELVGLVAVVGWAVRQVRDKKKTKAQAYDSIAGDFKKFEDWKTAAQKELADKYGRDDLL